MFDLFRFVMLRPAVPREPHELISTAGETDVQRQLERDRNGASPLPAMEQTSNQFLGSERAVRKPDSLAYAAAYDTLDASLRSAIPTKRAALLTKIQNAFDRAAGDLVADERFIEDRRRLADTLIAAKLGTPRLDLPLDVIARNLRLIALIQLAANGDVHVDSAEGIRAALAASIALPDGLVPVESQPAPSSGGGESPPDERERRRAELRREYNELTQAHDFLRDLPADQLIDRGAASGGADTEQKPERAHGDFADAIFREFRELRDAVVSNVTVEGRAGQFASATRVLQGAELRVRTEAMNAAPQAVQSGLRSARVDLATTSISNAVDRINARLRELTPQVVDEPTMSSNVSLVGGQFVATSQVPDLHVPGARREHA